MTDAVRISDPARIHGFDGIRGIGMIGVVMIHACEGMLHDPSVRSWSGVQYGAIDDRAWSVIRFSWIAVDLFFVLSGYLITGILLRARDDPHYFRNFYARRILRIFPLFYLVVLARLYLWPTGDYTALERFAHLAYWSNIWYACEPAQSLLDPALGVTWSLAIEEHFYLAWPLLVLALGRRALLRACIGLFLGALVLRTALVLGGGSWRFVWLFTLCRVDTMALGAILAIVGPDRVRGLRWWGLLTAALMGAAIWFDDTNASGQRMQTFGFTGNALFGGCLVVLALRGGLAARILSWRFLRRYGRHSYAIYLSHELVVEQLARLFVAGRIGWSVQPLAEAAGVFLPAALVFMAICVGTSLLVGWILWHTIESPFLSLSRFVVIRPAKPAS